MAIENQMLDKLSRTFELELPLRESMDDYLDLIIPNIRPWGDDLYEYEEKDYFETRWLEIRESEDFHESMLHIFNQDNEYLISIDGDIYKGSWRIFEKSNTMIIERIAGGSIAKSELYDLAYLSRDFFILKKHGDQSRKGHRRYFVMGRESVVKNLEWRDVVELLFNEYRSGNSSFTTIAVVIAIAILAFLIFSML
ncbi:MAG: hypothetical protein AB8G15_09730 [Saprospiraceae bacterium]